MTCLVGLAMFNMKNRVRCLKTGKVLAYEEIKNNSWQYQIVKPRRNADWGLWIYGTYPPPGIREAFTGKLDKNKVEIYAGTELGHLNESLGKVFWSEELLSWAVMDCGELSSLSLFSDEIEVIKPTEEK